MAEEETTVVDEHEEPQRKRKRRWAKRLGWFLAILIMPIVAVAIFFSSPIGKRFVADQIAQVAPASGLRFEVGRIEGDIYGQARLYDVVVSDPKGVFLTIPEVDLDWRPLNFLWSGLDIRELTAKRGRLERLPELLPGDPDAPILPDFDIRVDNLSIQQLVLAPGVAGERAATVDLDGKVDIREGRAFVRADGRLGADDRLALLLDAEPDGNRFDLELDYTAAEDGPIAQMAGLDAGYRARIDGAGTWSKWIGHALITKQSGEDAPERVAALRLTNIAGRYTALGKVDPDLDPSTLLGRATGNDVALVATGTLESSVFDGKLAVVTDALDLRGAGAVDLAGNAFDSFDITADLRDPTLFGDTARFENARFAGTLDGDFRDIEVEHTLQVGRLVSGTTIIEGLNQAGLATYDGTRFVLPLDASVDRVQSGVDWLDTRLVNGTLDGELIYSGSRLLADNTRISFPDLDAVLALRGNLDEGVFAIAGPVNARGLQLDNVGTVSGNAKVLVKFGTTIPWSVRANVAGRVANVSNASIANVAGSNIRFSGALGLGANQPIVFRDAEIDSERLTARFDSRIIGGRTTLAGRGRHTEYGPFTIDAEITGSGPRATLVLADPLPSAGLKDVRLAISPSGDGFNIDTSGQSMLGPFDGNLDLLFPAGGPARVSINTLEVYRTNVTGDIVIGEGGIRGDLALSGGGLDGTIAIAQRDNGALGFDVNLLARQAQFGGATNISIGFADIDASGSFGNGNSRFIVDARGSGLQYGAISINQFAANAEVIDGVGEVRASIAGRRSDRFQVKMNANVTPDRIALIAGGEFAGRPITMPRRAVLTSRPEGGWRLAPTQVGFADGFAIFEGAFGGGETSLQAKLSRMPLRIIDLTGSELGLGGRLSGIIDYNALSGAPPTMDARVKVENFTRSGLVLSSTPLDVLAVARLTPSRFSLGARLRDQDGQVGRLDARVTGLGDGSDIAGRIMRGRLNADFAYDGNATSLWRLAAIETFDLTGPINVTANATGTLNNPRITGRMASDNLRLQSAISGTDVTNVSARGQFAGSRLQLTRFSGRTSGNGRITGSGFIDLSGMSASRGPQIDIRAAATDARLLNANGLEATITGPLRIVSNGNGGTIAGRVRIDEASWALGTAAEDMSLPQIRTREINRPASLGQATSTASGSWRYLINATAPSRVAVDGMGLDSEWGVDIALRGSVDDPRIGGQANLVRGDYTFAGTRFELTRGRIRFDQGLPIDPRLDIEAETSASGVNVLVDITGTAQAPEIAFSSEPPLPEEEILARLLFGGSVTSLSATDALQLGAALASLRGGGGGLDPIGSLRRSIGLDQLRIVSADPALGRGTGVALGKNLGSDFYVEIVTDGRGYSATSVEYRITRWLTLLATVSTIGRDSVLAEVSRDY